MKLRIKERNGIFYVQRYYLILGWSNCYKKPCFTLEEAKEYLSIYIEDCKTKEKIVHRVTI